MLRLGNNLKLLLLQFTSAISVAVVAFLSPQLLIWLLYIEQLW